jgi:hypothetical protein
MNLLSQLFCMAYSYFVSKYMLSYLISALELNVGISKIYIIFSCMNVVVSLCRNLGNCEKSLSLLCKAEHCFGIG